MQSEPVVRLLGSEYADRGVLLAGLTGLEAGLDELEASLVAGEERATGLPRRAKAIAIGRRLPGRILAAHREWIDEVCREL